MPNKKIQVSRICLTVLLIALCFAKVYGYWQQEVNYKLNVQLDDKNHFLHAFAEIEYINYSPDTLKEIYFHLWPNAYKDNNTAFAKQKVNSGSDRFYFAKKSNKGSIDSLSFSIDGKPVKIEYFQKMADVIHFLLPEKLLPGKKINITTPFRVKIPASFSRLGRTTQNQGKYKFMAGPQGIYFKPQSQKNKNTSYQITQWYPKPAVYDKYGWHPMPYLDQGEFYSEFGKFEVKITVPKNYVVGATGIMDTNPAEEAWMLKREKETRERIQDGRIVSQDELIKGYKSGKKKNNAQDQLLFENDFPETEYKTLTFRQNNIHDFAFFLDKDFHVMTDSVILPYSKRVVKTCVLFTGKEAPLWKDAVQYVNDAVYYYSLWNGDYPYTKCTALEGALSAGAGMEYPMITIIGSSVTPGMLDNVIAHEVGHNWFYGILGTNERRFGWMDEGINSYYDNRYMVNKKDKYKGIPNKRTDNLMKKMEMDPQDASQLFAMEAMYRLNASRNMDQPINITSNAYTDMNYGCIVYGKTALVLNYLAGYLGQERFDTCMHRYYNKWKFRHPYPEDIEEVFEETTGENMDWFFKNVIGTKGQLDFAITGVDDSCRDTVHRVSINKDTIFITVTNHSGFPAPVEIGLADENGNILFRKWSKPFEKECIFKIANGVYHTAILDPSKAIPEVNRQNNRMKFKGLFKKCEPFRLQLGLDAGNGKHTSLYWFPISGYNTTDGTLLGLVFYNSAFPVKRFYYCLMPMYGFQESKLKGFATVNYHWYPQRFFRDIKLGIDFSSFSVFKKINSSISFTINPLHLRDSPTQKIIFSYHYLDFSGGILNVQDIPVYFKPREGFKLSYSSDYSNAIKKWHFQFDLLKVFDTWKTSRWDSLNFPYISSSSNILQGEFSYRQAFMKKEYYSVRLYQGITQVTGSKYNPNYLFINGNNDYLFEETLIDRAGKSDLFEHQVLANEGGFKSKNFESSIESISALNLTLDIPKIPVGIFNDIGIANIHGNNSAHVYNSGGIFLPVIRDYFEIFFPLWFNNLSGTKYSDNLTGNTSVFFRLKLGGMNIYEMLERVR